MILEVVSIFNGIQHNLDLNGDEEMRKTYTSYTNFRELSKAVNSQLEIRLASP